MASDRGLPSWAGPFLGLIVGTILGLVVPNDHLSLPLTLVAGGCLGLTGGCMVALWDKLRSSEHRGSPQLGSQPRRPALSARTVSPSPDVQEDPCQAPDVGNGHSAPSFRPPVTPIEVAGEMSLSDGLHVLWLAKRARPWVAGRNELTKVLIWLITGWALFLCILCAANEPSSPLRYVPLAIWLVLVGAAIRERYRMKQLWKRKEGIFERVEHVVSEDDIESSAKDATVTAKWGTFSKYKRSDRAILL